MPVIADSFSISDLSNKERESEGSYSPQAYNKGRKFISRKRRHGRGPPEEERKVRDSGLIILGDLIKGQKVPLHPGQREEF